MKIIKIQTKEFKQFINKTLLLLAEKAFLTYLALLFTAMIFGSVIYYQYNSLIKKTEVQIAKEPLQFQQKTYENILKIWQEREKKIKEADLKKFPDLPEIIQEEADLEESFGPSENIQEEAGLEEFSTSTGIDQE